MYKVITDKNQKKSRKKIALLLLGCMLALGLVFILLEVTGTTDFYSGKPAGKGAVTGGQYTKGQTKENAQAKVNTSEQPAASDSPKQVDIKYDAPTDNAVLIAPNGTFANVYEASLDEQMGSTCNTSPGATCRINFTQGTTVKSLSVKTADRGGAVYWSWKPSSIGLSSGEWHISAVATLGSKCETTNNDPLTLKVQK